MLAQANGLTTCTQGERKGLPRELGFSFIPGLKSDEPRS